MKPLLAFALFALWVTRGLAAIPEEIAGLIYYQQGGMLSTYGGSACVFSADGTYSGFYRCGYSPGGPWRLVDPDSGTYAYQKIDAETAQLTITPTSGTESSTVTLHFSSDSEGSIHEGVSWTYFNFVPVGSATALVNCSNRSYVRAGGAAFAGFVIRGGYTKVLLRAIGPSLSRFGITDHLKKPVLRVVRAKDNVTVAENAAWSAQSALSISRTSTVVGAFPLTADSNDAALITGLSPDVYICQVTSSDPADSGEAMIEVYLLP